MDLGKKLTDFLNKRQRRKPLKASGGKGHSFPITISWINSLKSWVSESVRQDIDQILTWKVFFLITNMFIYKKFDRFLLKRWKLVWLRACCHPRRSRGSQSGRVKRRHESFQAWAEEPLGTDSHRTISKRSGECWFLIGHKKCFLTTHLKMNLF